MEIVFDVPADRVEFTLELLRSISYVRNPVACASAKRRLSRKMDATDYLLSSDANAEHLRRSFEQLDRGEVVQVEIPEA